jgi:hypothetical protein
MNRIIGMACLVVPLLAGCSSTHHVTNEPGEEGIAGVAGDLNGREATILLEDWEVVEGRIVELRTDSLVFLDAPADDLRVVSSNSIREITISSGSAGFLKGFGIGFLVGGGLGALVGLASGDDKEGFIRFSAGEKAAGAGLTLGLLGGTIGGAVGAAQGVDETYVFKDFPPAGEEYVVIEVEEILEETASAVRIRYQGREILLPKRGIHINRTRESIKITVPRTWL